MNPYVVSLLECLSNTPKSGSANEVERCGLLLSMLVEKHSKQKTPGAFYDEVLPRPYSEIRLDEHEYCEIVSNICGLLTSTSISMSAKQAALFAIGGTDDRTLALTIPVVVQSLMHSEGQPIFDDCAKCLVRLLSSPEKVRNNALRIRQSLPNLPEALKFIRMQVGPHSEATVALENLQSLLAN